MFLRKKKVSDDTAEAKVIRQEAQEELRAIKDRTPSVNRMTRILARRREQNHFGEDIQITFRPKGGAA